MNPARQGPEFSTGITFNISSLPRRVTPSRLKRSYSEESVRRRAFGNENEPAFGMWAAKNLYPGTSCSRGGRDCECTTSVQKKSSPGIQRKISREKETGRFIARATQQVFPLCLPAIPLSQQQELPWQPDWSFQSPRAAGS
jgi:hypothetical protein